MITSIATNFIIALVALDSPPPVKTVTFETADGVTIEADYLAPQVKGDEKAPVVILIHMYPADRKSWFPFAYSLQTGNPKFAVLAYDIRGHGGSTEPREKNLKAMYDRRDPSLFRDAWKDVDAAKRWLARQQGCDVTRIALVGASIGCSIALDYAGRDRNVKAVVCLSPGTDYFGVDSISHIKKCDRALMLLVAPEAEYSPVEELIAASRGKAVGIKCPGGREWHGTLMLDEKYEKHASIKQEILKILRFFVDRDAIKPSKSKD
jgi:pimeloyl-ACP methyl ester carboxylesterase